MSLAVREMLQDRYEVVRNIKSGGMGSVYEAVDHKLASTPCAIKEVLASAMDGSGGAYVLQSFESEMRALAGLEHPNIPRVRDYFEIEGRRYIVLDLVQGQALDDELAEHLRLTHEPMDPAVAAVDMVQVLETLTYLHNCRPPIIHRDIKSANVLVVDEGAKLLDFGIARSVDGDSRTMTGEVLGTAHYLSPEQALGQKVGPATDIYSLGVLAHEMLTSSKPFDRGTPIATALAHVKDPPPSLPDGTPADLQAVVSACLVKEPEQRPTAALIAYMLTEAVDPDEPDPALEVLPRRAALDD